MSPRTPGEAPPGRRAARSGVDRHGYLLDDVTNAVTLDLKEEVQASIQEHRRLKRLLREITQIQLALIRSHTTEQARRGGRD